MQRLNQKILNGDNGDQKYTRCPDLQDENFEVMRSSISLDKFDLECAETVKTKPTIND